MSLYFGFGFRFGFGIGMNNDRIALDRAKSGYDRSYPIREHLG